MAKEQDKPRFPRAAEQREEPRTYAENVIVPKHVRRQIEQEREARENAGAPAQQKPPTTLADLQRQQPQSSGGEAAARRTHDAANPQ